MKAHDIITENIGKPCTISGEGDLSMNATFQKHISLKTPFIIRRLTKGGMVIILDDKGKEYSIPPKNIKL